MHIETSADARQSRRHAAGGGLAGPAADDRGYLAAAASRLSLWWHGASRPQGLTADTDPGVSMKQYFVSYETSGAQRRRR